MLACCLTQNIHVLNCYMSWTNLSNRLTKQLVNHKWKVHKFLFNVFRKFYVLWSDISYPKICNLTFWQMLNSYFPQPHRRHTLRQLRLALCIDLALNKSLTFVVCLIVTHCLNSTTQVKPKYKTTYIKNNFLT